MSKRKPKLVGKLELTLGEARKVGTLGWPYADASVKEVKIEKILEFIPGKERPASFNELYRESAVLVICCRRPRLFVRMAAMEGQFVYVLQ